MTEQTEFGNIGNRRIHRRTFLRGTAKAIGVGALVTAVGAGGGLGIPKLLDYLGKIERNGVDGRFLRRQEDGTLVINDTPQIVKVKYIPLAAIGKYWNKDSIITHRKPSADIIEGKNILPEEIKTPYAIRVAGGAYGEETDASRFEVTYKGRKHIVGEWFVPSDQQGNPVNPNGEPLKNDEKPYFIAANFVNVEATVPAPVK